ADGEEDFGLVGLGGVELDFGGALGVDAVGDRDGVGDGGDVARELFRLLRERERRDRVLGEVGLRAGAGGGGCGGVRGARRVQPELAVAEGKRETVAARVVLMDELFAERAKRANRSPRAVLQRENLGFRPRADERALERPEIAAARSRAFLDAYLGRRAA